ncbi:MAG: C40 family peptidase [Clostridia bacterium]|nr:C40 family peptidase [Clostridia bacterium]
MAGKLRFEDDENVGTEAAAAAGEAASRVYETAHRSAQRRRTAESKANPQSKDYQKRENANRWRRREAERAVRRSEEEARRVRRYFARHKRSFLIIGVLAATVLVLVGAFSSCSVFFQGVVSGITSSGYPAEDNQLLSAEEQYCAMEAELQAYLDSYETAHAYSEYIYDLDEIGHDPYVLISAVSALMGGPWEADEIGDVLTLLFEKQYILSETVTSEIRYRTEPQIGYYLYTDPVTGAQQMIPYVYEADVPYTHTVCTVKLENFDLSHVPAFVMTEEQLSLYANYMTTLGNRPDLFSDSTYVDLYYRTDYVDYDIPAELLEDAEFAAIIQEAEKFLGYPYVFGGSNPNTSFDCSGFVCWVLNHTGWDLGRLSAEGLRNVCTYVSPAAAQPGDLIFFEKTYDTRGASHVGVYVGDNWMIHAGDPIQYTRIDTNYWQNHFLSYGKLPSK